MALEQVHHWWDGPFMRRAPVASPGDMFWGRELTGDELDTAERGYSIGDLLEGSHLSYIMTLVPLLIDILVSGFVPPPPPSRVDPA